MTSETKFLLFLNSDNLTITLNLLGAFCAETNQAVAVILQTVNLSDDGHMLGSSSPAVPPHPAVSPHNDWEPLWTAHQKQDVFIIVCNCLCMWEIQYFACSLIWVNNHLCTITEKILMCSLLTGTPPLETHSGLSPLDMAWDFTEWQISSSVLLGQCGTAGWRNSKLLGDLSGRRFPLISS